MAQKLEQQLKEVGSKLESPPSTKDALLKLLKQAATCLSELDQSPPSSIMESMQPFLNAIVKPELLKHQDRDAKLLVATCICEITRITAPEAPYSDDVLKDIFHLIVGTFHGLSDTSGPSFGRRVVILETLAKYRSCVVMLDLECDDLVNEMFSTFFAVVRDDHPESVLSSMQTIMIVVLEESEDIRDDLLLIILSALGRNKSDVTPAARRLAMNVIEQCSGKLEAGIKQFLISLMSGDNQSVNSEIDYHEVIYDVYCCAPQILSGVVPYLTGELLTDQLDTRLRAVGLVGDLFALPSSTISEAFQPIFSEFLKRLTDRVVSVRMSVLEHVKSCLLSYPSRSEAPEIISALCDRLLDYDENVRKQVVAVICDVACHSLVSIPIETVKLVAERLRDKSKLVKKYTMERLAEIFRVYCASCSDGSINPDEFDWIPGRILRCFYDKDFRSETIESVLCGFLFPTEFSIRDKVKCWIRVFSGFDKIEVKALERMLEQKQRLQQEMQKYLSLRQMHQDSDAPEIQKKVLFGFRIMSRPFSDPVKAEECFQILDQLKDANIWKILMNLLDPNTSFHQASSGRDDLLKILGEKHRLYDFLSTLSLKCSYLLFNKEHVKEILLEAAVQKSTGNTQYTQSCMNLLVILARFCPLLLGGAEEELVNFLKDDNEIIIEGILHVLAKAGGTIREQLAVLSSSIDLILERLCLEGSRRQAKYAVHALAAITKDDGLKSLSVLYKRLVDMLEEKTHLPAVLQSLGCIAQTAMPVFETRESEIEEFIKSKILRCSNKADGSAKECWDDKSEICLLKVFGIKTLVKSYLPVKDAHLRPGIDDLLVLLGNILSFGEISEDIESSSVDKAHLRLAAAKAVLRLSRTWDHKIPLDVFHLTLRTPEISFPQARKLFLSKVHQYIKDRLLDAKYACAFLFSITGSKLLECDEEKQNLADIFQMCQQAKARQVAIQADTNSSTTYPEYILPYLVHALAHHSCPNTDECKDVKAFELIYRQLYMTIFMLVNKDEDTKSEAGANKEKESISMIFSIFQSIKRSEDLLDATKSKNSHAICDLGLSVMKRLAYKEEDLQGLIQSVSLPPLLYKPYEKKEGEDSQAGEGQTWLADENVLSHFESLKLECDGTAHMEIAEDESLKDSEIDGNEVPLRKMIKRLKSKGAKDGKAKKNKSPSAEAKDAENDVDILKMVREINLDSLVMPSKFESSNGHKHFPTKKAKLEQEHQKGKKRKITGADSVPVPKRRRSLPAHGAFKISRSASTVPSRDSGDDWHQVKDSSFQSTEMKVVELHDSKDKMPTHQKLNENTESDYLVSCIRRKRSVSSKGKGKGSDWVHSDEENEDGADDENVEKLGTTIGTKSVAGSSKKQKRRSISGLAKCSTKEGGIDIADLIGHRIKVWWPMDKQFYAGTVKSYDPIKRKHVVLYDDGDVEVLRLERERWELIDTGRKSGKKANSMKGSKGARKELSPGQKSKSSGGSRQNKSSLKIVKGKRTPKKNLKHPLRGALNSNFTEADAEEKTDASKSKPTAVNKIHKINSGDSEGAHTEMVDENLTDREESEKEVASVSQERCSEDMKGSPNQAEQSDEVKSDADGNLSEDVDSISGKAQKGEEEEKSHSEEKVAGDSTEDLREDASKATDTEPKETQESDNSESRSPILKKFRKGSSMLSDTVDSGISDDEPLSKWKRKAGKSGSKRVQ
ncbi:PREDICTED: sister chromatid cohesion protein PDS5 homolog A isoform X2 [Theobroma cacao]|uniref:Sister chromatid cohesion protein PDS5 homolog A isoform X2 n=1 Tax=Theobroma cacao TaxID=3641 RepID=A0AB32V158_THECC|nr:PREDICTED: sister chromatid cohesion protein PDS5 homolog A isoform X2 [Theobroma cacao]